MRKRSRMCAEAAAEPRQGMDPHDGYASSLRLRPRPSPRWSLSRSSGVMPRRSLRAPTAALLLLLLLSSIVPSSVEGVVSCSTTAECEEKLRKGSVCRLDTGTCSNPFEGGCLRAVLGEEKFPNLRACNSDDERLLGAKTEGDDKVCAPSAFDYTEIRTAPGGWESSMFLAFVLQIFLSELLGVPASIETSDADSALSFYDPDMAFPYPSVLYPFEALERAHNSHNADCSDALSKGESCAHAMPEVWNGQQKTWTEAHKSGFIEAPEGNGMVSKFSLYVPNFVAKNDSSLSTYHGLQGEENRAKLADAFKTPTTWDEYCALVSVDGCATDDGVAKRAPSGEELAEGGDNSRYFVPGLYTGYFRDTPESNCTANPKTCTGHFVDTPCTWSTNAYQQLYWNDIHLRSRGALEPNGGYSYRDMIDVWSAANETRSPVVMLWWRPDATIKQWQWTEAAFQSVVLPTPTEACQKARVTPEERCHDDEVMRRGNEEGKCGDEDQALFKIVAASLGEITYDSDAPGRSPAYDVLKSFRVSDLKVGTMLQTWIDMDVDQYGYDPRATVCEWVADNLDEILSFVPRGYPRTLVDEGWYGGGALPLLSTALVLGIVVTLLVIVSAALTHRHREKTVFVYAQYNFLLLILSGFLLVSAAATIYGLEPTAASCAAKQWLVTLGYTLGLVPLLVKVHWINKISRMPRRKRRKRLRPTLLLGAVAVVMVAVTIFLVTWTAVDPVTRREELVLTEEKGDVVNVRLSCSSNSDAWRIVAMTWEVLLLVVATVLSFQARNIPQKFNESWSLAGLVYSHFLFMAVEVIIYLLSRYGVLATNVEAGVTSLLLSLDTLFAIGIYFGPKFYRAVVARDTGTYRGSVNWRRGNWSVFSGSNGAEATPRAAIDRVAHGNNDLGATRGMAMTALERQRRPAARDLGRIQEEEEKAKDDKDGTKEVSRSESGGDVLSSGGGICSRYSYSLEYGENTTSDNVDKGSGHRPFKMLGSSSQCGPDRRRSSLGSLDNISKSNASSRRSSSWDIADASDSKFASESVVERDCPSMHVRWKATDASATEGSFKDDDSST